MTLQDPGDVIRESKRMLMETNEVVERASLLVNIHASYCQLGRLSDARHVLEEIKRMEIANAEVRLNVKFCESNLLVLEGRPEEALAAFAETLDRNREEFQLPECRYLYEQFQCRRASIMVDLSRFKEALPILREAVQFSFNQPADEQPVHYQLGVCIYHEEDIEAAQREFIEVVRFGLKDGPEERSLYFLGVIHYRNGAFAQSVLHLETILREFPDGSVSLPRYWVYEMLSRNFRHLGDKANERLYADKAKGKAGTAPK
jgi:tetratricopeptide (TPR) repeat protein